MNSETHGSDAGRGRHDPIVHDVRRGAGMGAVDMGFVLGAVVISGAAYVLGIAPVRAAAMDDGQARAELVKLDTEKRKLAEDYRSRRAARDAAASALQTSVRLVPETEINSRRASIAALAEQSAIQIQATRPLATLRGKRFDLVPIEIEGIGSATSFASFAKALRQWMPDTAIRSFELSVDVRDRTPRFTAQLVWYTLPESMSKGSVRTPSTDAAARAGGAVLRDRAGQSDDGGGADAPNARSTRIP